MRALRRLLGVSRISYEPLTINPVVFMDVTVEGDHVGRISIELFHDTTPQAAENFRSLCTGERGVARGPLTFKGVPFHRIIPDFVVQGGDIVYRDGRGNESVYGYLFPNESVSGKAGKHLPGTVAMASNGPNANGSQFFFNLNRSHHLDGKFMVLGQVIDGWEVVETMAKSCGSRCGTPVSRAWISECGQSGGLHLENSELLTGQMRDSPHPIPTQEVLNVLRPRF